MYCPNCGKQIPDRSQFCNYCGFNIATLQPPVNPHPVQRPVNPQPAAPAQRPAPQVQKQAPKSNKAPVKLLSFLLVVTFLASMLLLVASAFMPIANNIFHIPLFSVVMNIIEAEEDVDAGDLMKKAEDMFDSREQHYESIKDDLDEDRRELIEESFDTAEDFLDQPSLLNLRKMAVALEEETDEIEYDFYVGGINLMRNPVQKVDLLIWIFVAFFFLPFVFTVLGGLLRNRPLTIVALVLTGLVQLLLSGWIWFALSLVIYIAQAILCGKYKAAKASN